MARKNEYKIIIEYGPLPDESENGSAISDLGGGGGVPPPAPNQARRAAVAAVSSVVNPVLNAGLRLHTQQLTTLTGSAQLAQRQSLINGVVNGGVGFAESLLGGATVGAALGIGTGPAALVSVAMSAVSKALDIVARAEDLANRQEVENTAINVTRARAGVSWNRSRSR